MFWKQHTIFVYFLSGFSCILAQLDPNRAWVHILIVREPNQSITSNFYKIFISNHCTIQLNRLVWILKLPKSLHLSTTSNNCNTKHQTKKQQCTVQLNQLILILKVTTSIKSNNIIIMFN